jgi:hypothetical protein
MTNQEAIMSTHTSSRLAAAPARIRRIWSELDYANRRMFAIRTAEYLMNGEPEKESRGRAPRRTAVPAH